MNDLNKKIISVLTIPVMLVLGFFLSQNINGGILFGQSNVDVTASVGNVLSCTTDVSSTAFGTLTTGTVTTASPNAVTTVSCNDAAGCTLNVADTNASGSAGLYNATTTTLIASATETLTAGSEGYGIQAATSTAGSGAEFTIAAAYNKTSNDVGGLQTSATQLVTSAGPVTDREITVSHLAAISATTASGQYSDQINYTCTAN